MSSSCHLLAGNFATSLQIFIGIIAGFSLIYKRYFVESNLRPLHVWLLDVSKQVFSSMIIHVWNICQSIIFSNISTQNGNSNGTDECANYFMYFLLDTVLGVYLVWSMLRITQFYANKNQFLPLKHQGFYGKPIRMSWYCIQFIVFLVATLFSKIILGIFMYLFSTPADNIGLILFKPFHSIPNIELVVVMVVCPCFLSMIQYWIQDNFLMNAPVDKHIYHLVATSPKVTEKDSFLEVTAFAEPIVIPP
mmetsp:Transcript_3670/g.3272  ORF Transcript_3670/g.3272 Transcript_3670/m.3272 type:complete len:249 (-) Transcript_3670:134-880(-)